MHWPYPKCFQPTISFLFSWQWHHKLIESQFTNIFWGVFPRKVHLLFRTLRALQRHSRRSVVKETQPAFLLVPEKGEYRPWFTVSVIDDEDILLMHAKSSSLYHTALRSVLDAGFHTHHCRKWNKGPQIWAASNNHILFISSGHYNFWGNRERVSWQAS